MNTRDYKTFTAGQVYHIFNRGNNKQDIFLDRQDYMTFLQRVKLSLGYKVQTAGRVRLKVFGSDKFMILSYCLMPNHFHFLIKQIASTGIQELIHTVCTSYSKYFNRKYDRVGNLFQDSFKAIRVPVDEYLILLSAYIHINPGENFSEYEFSSYRDIIGHRNGQIVNAKGLLDMFNNDISVYQDFVNQYNHYKQSKISHLLLD